jgi:hypothetical protein
MVGMGNIFVIIHGANWLRKFRKWGDDVYGAATQDLNSIHPNYYDDLDVRLWLKLDI